MARFTMRLLIMLALGASLLVAGIATTAAADPRIEACGSDLPGNSIRATFDISRAARIWEHFPMMGMAPELARDTGPAFVVVFDGEYTAPWLDESGRPAVVRDAVCVVTSDGTVNVYYDVPRTGFSAP